MALELKINNSRGGGRAGAQAPRETGFVSGQLVCKDMTMMSLAKDAVDSILKGKRKALDAFGNSFEGVGGRVADPDLFGWIRTQKMITRSRSYRYCGNVKLYKQGKNILKI